MHSDILLSCIHVQIAVPQRATAPRPASKGGDGIECLMGEIPFTGDAAAAGESPPYPSIITCQSFLYISLVLNTACTLQVQGGTCQTASFVDLPHCNIDSSRRVGRLPLKQ